MTKTKKTKKTPAAPKSSPRAVRAAVAKTKAAPKPKIPERARRAITSGDEININLSREPAEDSTMARLLPFDPAKGHKLRRICFSKLGGIVFDAGKWYEIPVKRVSLLAVLRAANQDGTITEAPKKNVDRAFEFIETKGGAFVRAVREEFNRAERVAMGVTREGEIDREVLVHGIPSERSATP